MKFHRFQHQCNADLGTRYKYRKEGMAIEYNRVLEELTEELEAMRDLGDHPKYIEGFEHAIWLLRGSDWD